MREVMRLRAAGEKSERQRRWALEERAPEPGAEPGRVAASKLTRLGEPAARPAAAGKLTRSASGQAMAPEQALEYAQWLGEHAQWTARDRWEADGGGEPFVGSLSSAFDFLAIAGQEARPAVVLREAESASTLEEGEAATALPALRWSSGEPLPAALRLQMEQLLGASFEDVRIHRGHHAEAAATALAARAFTIADHVFFQRAAFDPDSEAGRRLIAHELAHVLQWRAGRVPATSGLEVSHPDDALEREADDIGRRVAAAAPIPAPVPAPVAARAPSMPDWAGAPSRAASQPAPLQSQILRERDPHASVDQIPAGGVPVDKVGVVSWDGTPALRLRSSDSTSADNLITSLPFNTRLQVIKELPGKWYFVSTELGDLGYVAKDHVKTNLPEPKATLHKVEPGRDGFALFIAERYYKQYADDWGQDLRFLVNALAWVNGRPIPDGIEGWKRISFKAGELIWIPSYSYARSLRSVVPSGSYKHAVAEVLGVADFLDRTGELWSDIRRAVALSTKYIPEAIVRHVAQAMVSLLESLVQLMVASAAIMALSTAIGAAIGSLAGGVGAVPGAAAGFEVGLALLNWLGLAFLVAWIGASMVKVGSAFVGFFAAVWNARGDADKIELAAQSFAEALGVLCGVLVEALVMWMASAGVARAFNILKGTRFGKNLKNSKAGEWLSKRAENVANGKGKLPTPKQAWDRFAWNRTAIAKRLEALFGEAAPEAFRPIGKNRVDVHGDLKISGAALEKLSDADLIKLVELCKQKGGGAKEAYAYFESTSTAGGKPGARLRFESRLNERVGKVQRELLETAGIKEGDARAKLFEEMTDADRTRLWDLFNEQVYQSPEMRKSALEWALSKKPKTPRELVAQLQFFEAEAMRQGKLLSNRVSAEVATRVAKESADAGRELSGAERRGVVRDVTQKLLGRKLDELGPAADRAARAKVFSEMGREGNRAALEETWKLNNEAQSGADAAGTLSIGNHAESELPAVIQSKGEQLSFGNRPDGAYHAHKHSTEVGLKVEPKEEMAAYLSEARRLIRSYRGKVRANQNGSVSVVVEAEGKRVIVSVNDGKAVIATFGTE